MPETTPTLPPLRPASWAAHLRAHELQAAAIAAHAAGEHATAADLLLQFQHARAALAIPRRKAKASAMDRLPLAHYRTALAMLARGLSTQATLDQLTADGCAAELLPSRRTMDGFNKGRECEAARGMLTSIRGDMAMAAALATVDTALDCRQLQARNNYYLFQLQTRLAELMQADLSGLPPPAKVHYSEKLVNQFIALARVLHSQCEAEYKRRYEKVMAELEELRGSVGKLSEAEVERRLRAILMPANVAQPETGSEGQG